MNKSELDRSLDDFLRVFQDMAKDKPQSTQDAIFMSMGIILKEYLKTLRKVCNEPKEDTNTRDDFDW